MARQNAEPPQGERAHRRTSAVVGIIALAAIGAIIAIPAFRGGGQDTLPVTLENLTGVDGDVYVYVLGENTDAESGEELGYVDANGSFHTWPAVDGSGPIDAPDVAIAGPASGEAVTLHVPSKISGRIYYSIGEPIDFKLVQNDLDQTGLVQPVPWIEGDSTATTNFDWVEFTYFDEREEYPGIWINSTQVDQFAIPTAVTVTSSDSSRDQTGRLTDGGRAHVIDTLLADPVWKNTVVTGEDGDVLRVLSPAHATEAGLLPDDYLDEAIDEAWNAYTTDTLTIQPFAEDPDVEFEGATEGDIMTFTDADGTVVAEFERPSTVDVWGCDGNLNGLGNDALPNDHTTGPIGRTLCAALHRGTLGTSDVEPVTDASEFYQNEDAVNLYARALHEAMEDGRAYAFAFDDVAAQESLVHTPSPTAVTLTMQPLNGGANASAEGEAAGALVGSGAAGAAIEPAVTRPAAEATVLRTAGKGAWAEESGSEGTEGEPGGISAASGDSGTASGGAANGDGKDSAGSGAGTSDSESSVSGGSSGSGGASASGGSSSSGSSGSGSSSGSSGSGGSAGSGSSGSGSSGSGGSSSGGSAPAPAPSGGTQTLSVTFQDGHPGYATLNLGSGTTPGVVTVAVSGGSTSTASVDGPGNVRVDLGGSTGTHSVTVSSTGALGTASISLPPPTSQPAAGAHQVTIREGHPGYVTLSLGSGTGPGVVTVAVAGGATSTASVDGPGDVRVDLAAAPGTYSVSVTSTGTLGSVSIRVQ